MKGDGVVAVWVSIGTNRTLLANLSQNVSQVQIDVAFGTNQRAEFYVRAPFEVTVYLSGYYIIDDEASSEHSVEDKNSCNNTKYIDFIRIFDQICCFQT